MRRSLVVSGAIVLSVGAIAHPASIKRLAWLQGCWEATSANEVTEEQWMAPRGNSMVGISRTVRGSALTGHEFLVIREQGDRLAYEAHPSGQASAVFLARTVDESHVLFEDLQHDFPQRIGYQRSGSDSMLAWIEGVQQGQVQRIDFEYRRVGCPGQ